jgi:hypothetical protein
MCQSRAQHVFSGQSRQMLPTAHLRLVKSRYGSNESTMQCVTLTVPATTIGLESTAYGGLRSIHH